MSDYAEAVRELLEPTLVCPKCREVNSKTLRPIRVDINGVACCATCGKGGDVRIFQLMEKRT